MIEACKDSEFGKVCHISESNRIQITGKVKVRFKVRETINTDINGVDD